MYTCINIYTYIYICTYIAASNVWLPQSGEIAAVVNSSSTVPNSSLVVWGIHDFKWSSSESNTALEMARADVDVAKCNPLENVVVCAGDLNRPRLGDERVYLDPLAQAQHLSSPSVHLNNCSQANARWDHLLGTLMDSPTTALLVILKPELTGCGCLCHLGSVDKLVSSNTNSLILILFTRTA